MNSPQGEFQGHKYTITFAIITEKKTWGKKGHAQRKRGLIEEIKTLTGADNPIYVVLKAPHGSTSGTFSN